MGGPRVEMQGFTQLLDRRRKRLHAESAVHYRTISNAPMIGEIRNIVIDKGNILP